MESKEKGLSAFSDETLNEMAMEKLEGGGIIDLNYNKCPNTGNCVPGCACSGPVTPSNSTEAAVEIL